ncbi:MAG: helix-turn-helix domain-containing protein [Chitinophagaceae bacterium]|jgi:transcriptional regulator with XRE-family HTH domain|nr:helix-turn-helix domain-containing protein [Chitinophagaceae bacterium]
MAMGKCTGLRIREVRIEKNLTQEEFSAMLDIDPVKLLRIEDNKSYVSAEILNKIISNFDIDANWLLSGKGKMQQNEHRIGDISNSTVVGANISGHGVSIHHPISEEIIAKFSKNCSEISKQIDILIATTNKLQEQIDYLSTIINKLNDKAT